MNETLKYGASQFSSGLITVNGNDDQISADN